MMKRVMEEISRQIDLFVS